jgi:hypothetical protein
VEKITRREKMAGYQSAYRTRKRDIHAANADLAQYARGVADMAREAGIAAPDSEDKYALLALMTYMAHSDFTRRV